MTQKYQLTDFLPTNRKECELRGWDELDMILFSGDAYVDHPSFGAAVIGRLLEAKGYKVAIVPQPDWHGDYRDFKKLGRPRLFFSVSAGAMDSMVNRYTANRRIRHDDAYSPDARHDMRPDYPSIVYTKILKQLFPDVPVVLGGIEASMRRLTHYDYWQDRLMKCILCDSGADMILYGMGEKNTIQLCHELEEGRNIKDIHDIPQTVSASRKTSPGVSATTTSCSTLTRSVCKVRKPRLRTSAILRKSPIRCMPSDCCRLSTASLRSSILPILL